MLTRNKKDFKQRTDSKGNGAVSIIQQPRSRYCCHDDKTHVQCFFLSRHTVFFLSVHKCFILALPSALLVLFCPPKNTMWTLTLNKFPSQKPGIMWALLTQAERTLSNISRVTHGDPLKSACEPVSCRWCVLCSRTIRTELLNVVTGRGAAGDGGDMKPQGAPVGVSSQESFSHPEEVMGRGSRYASVE